MENIVVDASSNSVEVNFERARFGHQSKVETTKYGKCSRVGSRESGQNRLLSIYSVA